jgi:hypothetical protein
VRPISEGPDIPERVPPALLRAWATKLRQLQAAHDRAVARAQAAQRRAALLIRQRALYQAELARVNAQITATQEAVARKTSRRRRRCRRRSTSTEPPAMPRRPDCSARIASAARSRRRTLCCCFPVRVETRFAARRTGPGTDLLLRVYPDDIHLDSHEPALTEEEERLRQGILGPCRRRARRHGPTGAHQARLATTHGTIRHDPRRVDRPCARSCPGRTGRSPQRQLDPRTPHAGPAGSLGRRRLSQRCSACHRLGQAHSRDRGGRAGPRQHRPARRQWITARR